VVESYSTTMLLQRLASAAFCHATGGENWNSGGWKFDSTLGWMDHDAHECDWAFANDSNVIEMENLAEWHLVKDKPCELMMADASGVEGLVCDRLWFRDAEMSGSLPPEVFLLLTNLKAVSFR